jgi:hypothetical protein
MKLLTALGLTAALLLSSQPAAGLGMPTLRSKAVCLKVLKKANAANKSPNLMNCDLRRANLKGANLFGSSRPSALVELHRGFSYDAGSGRLWV